MSTMKFKNNNLRYIVTCLLSMTLTASIAQAQQPPVVNSTIAPQPSVVKNTIVYSSDSGKLSNQGHIRTFYIYTPKSYNPSRPMPLVMVFHGDGGSGRSISTVTHFNDLAEQKGFIAVYPDAINNRWSLSTKSSRKVDDGLFVASLIEGIQQTKNIDSTRIYATGFSKGAILAQALACQMPNKIAAFASVAGSLPSRLKPSCQAHPVSMMMINGTKDQSVNYEGDATSQRLALISVPETVNFWRTQDQCLSPVQNQQVSKPNPSHLLVKTSRYANCRAGSEVMLASVVNGGHFWPGGASTDPTLNKVNANLGFNATKTIWTFFERHNLSQSYALKK